MRSDVRPLTPDDTLDRALELFVENDLLALPVVDDLKTRKVVGMVRRFEISSAYLRHIHGPASHVNGGGLSCQTTSLLTMNLVCLRVLQTKSETKAFYDKIAKVYDLLSEHSERPMREVGLKMLVRLQESIFWKSASGRDTSWSSLPMRLGQRERSSALTSPRTCWPSKRPSEQQGAD